MQSARHSRKTRVKVDAVKWYATMVESIFNYGIRGMAQDAARLIWLDMEMTGLSPETDRIIEVALVITDNDLNSIVESPVLVVRQDDATLRGMDAWNQATHARTGLIDKVKNSVLDEASVEKTMVAFL